MYNRYIPQPDGSYRRNRIQDAERPVSPPPQQSQPTQEHPRPPQYKTSDRSNQIRRNVSKPSSAGSFLRQLLPGNLDTEDLLIIVLLLLMAGDCEEERNTALLTLALYLFL